MRKEFSDILKSGVSQILEEINSALESLEEAIPEPGDLEKENARLEKELEGWKRLALQHQEEVMKYMALEDDPWRWQGDGTDDLESLTCPVLITAEDLRELIKVSKVHIKYCGRVWLDRSRESYGIERSCGAMDKQCPDCEHETRRYNEVHT
jgi:hypothetical protein